MKPCFRKLFLLPTLMAGFGLISVTQLIGQTFTTLHDFVSFSGSSYTNNGAYPFSGVIFSEASLYGTAIRGGNGHMGTVFRINTDGTDYTNLYSFTETGGPLSTNIDGTDPTDGLILSGNTLYGTAYYGGSSGNGTVFKVNTDGTGFTVLHGFTATSGAYPVLINSDGANPYGGLILSGSTLYGTTYYGGSLANGTVFAVNIEGTDFTILHNFTNGSDGVIFFPVADLILSEDTLYGTRERGGSSGNGTVFAVKTDGTGFTNLHGFTATGLASTNSDGAYPSGGVILSGKTLYGTAYGGGAGYGTVFKVNTDGTGFMTMHSFSGGTNGDGPVGGLILLGNTLYGTTYYGGSSDNGAVFRIGMDGTGFAILCSFNGGSEGAHPVAGVIFFENILYGTTLFGGSSDLGTVFSFSLPPPPPQLTTIRSGLNIVLTWPTNAAGFTLQSTTNFVAPVVWNTNLPLPTIVNGQNTVTNPVSGTQQFFRLSQ